MDSPKLIEIRWLPCFSASDKESLWLLAGAHLVPDSAAPFNHFWDSLCVQTGASFADRVDHSGVGLQGVQGRHGILRWESAKYTYIQKGRSIRHMTAPF